MTTLLGYATFNLFEELWNKKLQVRKKDIQRDPGDAHALMLNATYQPDTVEHAIYLAVDETQVDLESIHALPKDVTPLKYKDPNQLHTPYLADGVHRRRVLQLRNKPPYNFMIQHPVLEDLSPAQQVEWDQAKDVLEREGWVLAQIHTMHTLDVTCHIFFSADFSLIELLKPRTRQEVVANFTKTMNINFKGLKETVSKIPKFACYHLSQRQTA